MFMLDYGGYLFRCSLQFEHPICWSYVVDLYMSGRESTQSLTIVPKFLTSLSKMRVDLTAQVGIYPTLCIIVYLLYRS